MILKIAAIAMGLLHAISPLRGVACTGGKDVPLGFGDVLITIPDGWSIDDGTVRLEVVSYVVKRPNSKETALRVILSAAVTHYDVGLGARPYCVNGLVGVTAVRDGVRRIRLDLPPPNEFRLYDSKAIFIFQESDADVEKIVGSVRLKSGIPKCPRSAVPKPSPGVGSNRTS